MSAVPPCEQRSRRTPACSSPPAAREARYEAPFRASRCYRLSRRQILLPACGTALYRICTAFYALAHKSCRSSVFSVSGIRGKGFRRSTCWSTSHEASTDFDRSRSRRRTRRPDRTFARDCPETGTRGTSTAQHDFGAGADAGLPISCGRLDRALLCGRHPVGPAVRLDRSQIQLSTLVQWDYVRELRVAGLDARHHAHRGDGSLRPAAGSRNPYRDAHAALDLRRGVGQRLRKLATLGDTHDHPEIRPADHLTFPIHWACSS